MEHIADIIARNPERKKSELTVPVASAVISGRRIIEMVCDISLSQSALVQSENGTSTTVSSVLSDRGTRLVPYSPRNNLIAHRVVLFPSVAEEYESENELLSAIQAFIHRYVDLSPLFERIASHYVLLSWLYDTFNELPYLRVRGEPGSGKTRFLLTVGSICYKPTFASGASTVSPIFRILDAIQGTLVLDESDFRMSDERAEVVKILNNGNIRGFPVLRTEQVPGTKEFNPRAYHVFGPKIIATRGSFDDPALESRFISERMEVSRLRVDIPITLPKHHAEEALHLRNKLLLFRFRNYAMVRDPEQAVDRSLEPRLAQIFAPLMSVVHDEETRKELLDLARTYGREMTIDRGLGIEGVILEIIRNLWGPKLVSIGTITRQFMVRHGTEYPMVTPKRIGGIVRRNLGLSTERQGGLFVISATEGPKLRRLFERYGLEPTTHVQVGLESPQHPQSPEDAARQAA